MAVATTWVPMGAQVPILSPNDYPNPSSGQHKGFMKIKISKNFHMPLSSLSSVKAAKSSLARGQKGGGGGTGGSWNWDPGPLPWVKGSIYKKKVLWDPSPNAHIAATMRKEVLTPSRSTGYPGAGGYGGQNPKNHWGIIFGPKMMILQTVRRHKPTVGLSYVNDPKKGGYTMLVRALDLTTSLRSDLEMCDNPCQLAHCRVRKDWFISPHSSFHGRR